MSGAGKKTIDALKAKFIYPAMLITALNFSACKSDKNGADTERGKDSLLTENVVANEKPAIRQHFDSSKVKAPIVETSKINRADDLHYDERASFNGQITKQLNALGKGVNKHALVQISPQEQDSFEVFALEFFFDESDIEKTGKDFKGYVVYGENKFDGSNFVTVFNKHKKGDYTARSYMLNSMPKIYGGNKGDLLSDSIRFPLVHVIGSLDMYLKSTKNIISDGKLIDCGRDAELFIEKIAKANDKNVQSLRAYNGEGSIAEEVDEYYKKLRNDRPHFDY